MDSHAEATRYNDDPDYYNKDNPICTVYSFEDAPTPALPQSNIRESLSSESFLNCDSGRLRTAIAYDKHSLALWNIEKKTALVSMLLRHIPSGKEIFADTLSHWDSVEVTESERFIREREG